MTPRILRGVLRHRARGHGLCRRACLCWGSGGAIIRPARCRTVTSSAQSRPRWCRSCEASRVLLGVVHRPEILRSSSIGLPALLRYALETARPTAPIEPRSWGDGGHWRSWGMRLEYQHARTEYGMRQPTVRADHLWADRPLPESYLCGLPSLWQDVFPPST
jgi:hypothetical protein